MIRKSLDNANFSASNNSVVCSNHFAEGKPTPQSPLPTCFLTESDVKWKSSPKKRKKVARGVTDPPLPSVHVSMTKQSTSHYENPPFPAKVPMHFSQITRESAVKLFTGIKEPETFKFLFQQLSLDARSMTYWRGKEYPERICFSCSQRAPTKVVPRTRVLNDPHEVATWVTE